MTIDEFWKIVERVHAASPKDMEAKCRNLAEELRLLPLPEVASFDSHLTECYYRANSWDLWGAAWLIRRGCGDDSFTDFRYTLISLGKHAFEAALANADNLAEFDIEPAWATYEGYQYVSSKVYKERCTSDEMPRSDARSKYPQGPQGMPFNEDEMTPRFPRLVAKYEHQDAPPEDVRKRKRIQAAFYNSTELVKALLLRGVIPRCGMVPPLRIVRKVFASGRAPAVSGLRSRWEPFDLDESAFWNALAQLKALSATDLRIRPDLEGKSIALDTDCPGINDYEVWIRSLEKRGYKH
jgi:hypothetical protein